MNISFPHLNLLHLSKIKKDTPVIFRDNKAPCTDTFERTTVCDKPKNAPEGTIKCVKLKDSANNSYIDGYIIKDSKNRYIMYVNGEKKCFMDVVPTDECLHLDFICNTDGSKSIKGSGKELVKYAVQLSKEMGNKGRVKLYAAGSQPFHYKNNFRIMKHPVPMLDHSNEYNAALDYATRKGVEPKKILYMWNCAPMMFLDEKNAQALENGIRLIDNSKSRVLYSKEIDGEWYDMDFCDLGDDFVLQLINKDYDKGSAQKAILEGKIENGKLVPDYNKFSAEEFKDEFNSALKLAQKIYSCGS